MSFSVRRAPLSSPAFVSHVHILVSPFVSQIQCFIGARGRLLLISLVIILIMHFADVLYNRPFRPCIHCLIFRSTAEIAYPFLCSWIIKFATTETKLCNGMMFVEYRLSVPTITPNLCLKAILVYGDGNVGLCMSANCGSLNLE